MTPKEILTKIYRRSLSHLEEADRAEVCNMTMFTLNEVIEAMEIYRAQPDEEIFKIIGGYIYPYKGKEFADIERMGDKKGWQNMNKETFNELKKWYIKYLVKHKI